MPELPLSRWLAQRLQALEGGREEPLAGWLFAADCHRRMLELAEHHRPEALPLACGGAQLFARLQQLHGEPPGWALVLEEQCCRYGVIWLQEAAAAGQVVPEASQLRPLLERLRQFHPEAPTWIQALAGQLESAPGSTPQPPADQGAAALVPYGFFEPAQGPEGATAPIPIPAVELLDWSEPCITYSLTSPLVEGVRSSSTA